MIGIGKFLWADVKCRKIPVAHIKKIGRDIQVKNFPVRRKGDSWPVGTLPQNTFGSEAIGKKE